MHFLGMEENAGSSPAIGSARSLGSRCPTNPIEPPIPVGKLRTRRLSSVWQSIGFVLRWVRVRSSQAASIENGLMV